MAKPAGRIMGIDFGMKHIGVALSDESRIIARGYETVNWNGVDDTWAINRICEIIKEMNWKRSSKFKEWALDNFSVW